MLFTVLGAYRRAISSFHASTCSLSTRPPWGSRAAKAVDSVLMRTCEAVNWLQ